MSGYFLCLNQKTMAGAIDEAKRDWNELKNVIAEKHPEILSHTEQIVDALISLLSEAAEKKAYDRQDLQTALSTVEGLKATNEALKNLLADHGIPFQPIEQSDCLLKKNGQEACNLPNQRPSMPTPL